MQVLRNLDLKESNLYPIPYLYLNQIQQKIKLTGYRLCLPDHLLFQKAVTRKSPIYEYQSMFPRTMER